MTTQTIEHDCTHRHGRNHHHWVRLAFMLAFAFMLHLAGLVMWLVCGLQFLTVLINGEKNTQLQTLGQSVSTFFHRALNYVSYNTDEKPFPFSSWQDSAEPEIRTEQNED